MRSTHYTPELRSLAKRVRLFFMGRKESWFRFVKSRLRRLLVNRRKNTVWVTRKYGYIWERIQSPVEQMRVVTDDQGEQHLVPCPSIGKKLPTVTISVYRIVERKGGRRIYIEQQGYPTQEQAHLAAIDRAELDKEREETATSTGNS